MGLDRITDSNFADQAKYDLNYIGKVMNKYISDLSDGQTVHKPSDAPDKLSRAFFLKNLEAENYQYTKNLTFSKSVSASVGSALEGMNEVLSRAHEIAALTNTELSVISHPAFAVEMDALLEQMVEQGNQVSISGDYLFAGTKNDTPPFSVTRDASGKITAVTYNGNSDQAERWVSKTSKLDPYGDSTTNTSLLYIMNTLKDVRDALKAGNATQIATYQKTTLNTALDYLVGGITKCASTVNRIEQLERQNAQDLDGVMLNLSEQLSTDYNKTIVDFTQLRKAYEASSIIYPKILGIHGLIQYI